jgi:hypothetical protein
VPASTWQTHSGAWHTTRHQHYHSTVLFLTAPFSFWLCPSIGWVQLQRSCLRDPCNTLLLSTGLQTVGGVSGSMSPTRSLTHSQCKPILLAHTHKVTRVHSSTLSLTQNQHPLQHRHIAACPCHVHPHVTHPPPDITPHPPMSPPHPPQVPEAL